MKKLVAILICLAVIFTSVMVFADSDINFGHLVSRITDDDDKDKIKDNFTEIKEKFQSFKINNTPVLKYGSYILPIQPVEKGMGASLTYIVYPKHILVITKATTTIEINIDDKTVKVNGILDNKSGIFTAKNSNKTTVLLKYIADKLGVRTNINGNNIDMTIPGLSAPRSITVTAIGGNVKANTLNTTNTHMTASARITAGQAAGGKAELYVGALLVAVDGIISSTDTTVNFTTSDGTPINSELRTAIPAGGIVSVKLYNSTGQVITSSVSNPTLIVDYSAPTITTVVSAIYVSGINPAVLYVSVTGAANISDNVDVSKITIIDPSIGLTRALTNSTGVVSGGTLLTVTLSNADKAALVNAGGTDVVMNIGNGLLTDVAGNVSADFTIPQSSRLVMVY